MKKIVFGLICIMIAATSCKKEMIDEKISNLKEEPNTGSIFKLNEEEEYDKMLRSAAIGLLAYANDNQFKGDLKVEVLKQFDGDDNVLLNIMSTYKSNMPLDLQDAILSYGSEYDCYTSLSDIGEVVNGFYYFDEMENVQIYVPFVQNVNFFDIPIICPDPNEDEILTGFFINQFGQLDSILVDEEYAENHYVWVVTVNERVSSAPSYSGTVSTSFSPETDAQILWYSCTVTDKHEKWGHGRAEISYAAEQWNDDYCTTLLTENQLYCFNKYSKDELENEISLTQMPLALYSPLSGQLPSVLSLYESLGIVLYEQDERKKFNKSYDAPTGLSCGVNQIEYTSKDDAYFRGVMYNSFQTNQLPGTYTEFELIGGVLPIQNAYDCTSVKVRYRIYQ